MLEFLFGDQGKGMQHIHLDIKVPSLDDLYKECYIVSKEGDEKRWEEYEQHDDKEWVGLSREDILKYKYGYTPGMKELHKIEDLLLDAGSSEFYYKWDEIDGDEMDMERMYDERFFLQKRMRREGILTGKFVDVYVAISEVAYVEYEQMLYKTYTAIAIADYLEQMGYRTSIYAVESSISKGTYKRQWIKSCYIEVCVKKYEDPIIKPLLINCFSPWMFRHWFFMLISAKVKPAYGLGSSRKLSIPSTREKIYIDVGECIDEESAKKKFKELKNLFDNENKIYQ